MSVNGLSVNGGECQQVWMSTEVSVNDVECQQMWVTTDKIKKMGGKKIVEQKKNQ